MLYDNFLWDKLFGAKKGADAEQKTTKGQSAKFQQTSGEENVESERMKTLQSNKLPLILAGVGGALGALGWIAQTQWFKDLITTTVKHPAQFGEKTFTSTIENNLKVDPKGWSYTIQNNGFMDATGKSLNFNQPVGNLKDAFKFYGGGDQAKGIEAMSHFLGGGGKASSVADITRQLADPTNKTVGDIFNHLEGTWGDKVLMNQNGGSKNFIAKQVYTQTKKVLIKAGFTTTTTSVLGAKLVALAPILTGVGIALVGAGAVVKLLREKGQRQSRAKTLNDLLQSLVPIKVEAKQGSDEEGKGEGEEGSDSSNIPSEKSIYPLMIKNLTQLRSLISTAEGVKLEGEPGVAKGNEVGKGKEKQKVPQRYKKAVAAESVILRFEDILNEDKTFGKQRNVEVTKGEDYLTQAVTNIRKSIKSLKDEKDKGIGITYDFISAILDKKMDSNTKEPVKELYSEIYDYLYGSKAKTLGEFAPLYKESVEVISNKGKRQVVAEKMARFAKRAQQFEGEGFYGGMGEFGADMQDWNKSFKEIMSYFKAKSEVKESKIFRFKDI